MDVAQEEKRPWPSTPLDAAQRAFDLLVCSPARCRSTGAFAGVPLRILPLDELKKPHRRRHAPPCP
jgi:hypothetical protein